MQTVDMKFKRAYTFWLSAISDLQQDKQIVNYQELVKKIGTFSTAQDFWSFYQYMVRPEKLPDGSQFLLFQDQIQPVWEDPQNTGGGRFILRVRRGWANRLWEELMLAFIGDDSNKTQSICGLIVHAKKHFILISIWVKVDTNEHQTIEEWIIKTLGLNKNNVEFMDHPKNGDN